MGQSGWWYSGDEQGRRGSPAVPPQWQQEGRDPHRQPPPQDPRGPQQPYGRPLYGYQPQQPQSYPGKYQSPQPRFTPQTAPSSRPQQPPPGPGAPYRPPPPSQQYAPPPQPPARAPKARKPQQGKPGNPLLGFAIILAVLGLAVWGLVSVFGGNGGSTPPAAASAATVSASHAAVAAKPGFPPTTLAGFQSFAATGDASQLHEVASVSEGLPSCPQPNRIVTASPEVTGRALEADLSAYFVQNGLLSNQCGAVVFAYHSMSDYQANKDNGFTAGRVILSNNGGSDPQLNLEVDAGSATNMQAEFDFDF